MQELTNPSTKFVAEELFDLVDSLGKTQEEIPGCCEKSEKCRHFQIMGRIGNQ